MCHLCETRRICEALEKQITNIQKGGSISPETIARIMAEAQADLTRHMIAAAAFEQIVRGLASFDFASGDLGEHGGKGGLH